MKSKEGEDDSLNEIEMEKIEDSKKEIVHKEEIVDTLSGITGSRDDNPVWHIKMSIDLNVIAENYKVDDKIVN